MLFLSRWREWAAAAAEASRDRVSVTLADGTTVTGDGRADGNLRFSPDGQASGHFVLGELYAPTRLCPRPGPDGGDPLDPGRRDHRGERTMTETS